MKDNFLYSCSSNIDNQILDNLKSKDDIVSVSLSIKASHAGKVNGNYVFYTPRGMKKGVQTLVYPFKKHLQNLHRGDSVGEINDAFYSDYTEQYSTKIQQIAKDIDEASSPLALVTAVKELTKQPEYKNSGFKGLGVLQVSAELYDAALIQDLSSGTNKGKVSIGGNSKRVYCSVCASLFTRDHEHQRGRSYNGETCFAVYDTMELDHVGFVPDPADTATETVIISDSLDDNNSSVTIDDFKIQDNTQGQIMNIEQLKQFASDANNLVNIAGLSDVQKDFLKEAFTSGKKHARSSGYLLSEDKLLPVTTKETTAMTAKAVEQLTDSTEKQVLLDLLAPYIDKFFADTTVDEFLAEIAKDAVQSAMTDDVTKMVENEGEASAARNQVEEEAVAKAQAEASAFDFSVENIEKLVANAVEKTIAALQPAPTEPAKIQDSVEYGLLLANHRQLTSDIEALDLTNTELTKRCKDAIISQILTLKGVKKDSDYAKRLADRDLDSLTTTLQDTEFELDYLVESKAVKADEGSEDGQEAAATEVNQQVQDSVTQTAEATVDNPTDEADLEKTELKDSLTNLNVDEKAEVKDSISDVELIKREGFASYLRKIKTNK